jgi:phage anti-repressor protein
MTASKFAQDRDLILECITKHYNRGQRGNHRVQLKVDQFKSVTLVECEHKGKLFRDWFLDGAPAYTYWLTRDQRIDIVKSFYEAGYSGIKIATMLKFGSGTIYRDIKWLRENGILPEGRPEKEAPEVVKGSFKIAKLELVANTGSEVETQRILSKVRRTMAASTH